MAYARLGVAYFNLNQPTLAAENTAKAYELREHTSAKEKLYITCHYHDLVTGDVDQTIAPTACCARPIPTRSLLTPT
ncbi:MAG TPA: hypothetical protein VII95_20355 [Terriglobales bacterium]|jgi:hypothetical protein